MTLRQHLQRAWLSRGLTARLLLPVSWIYGLLAASRRALYAAGLLKSRHFPVPVVVVGNPLVGGAGKTPLAIALVRHLKAQGRVPAVVSRGFGRTNSACLEVLPAMGASEAGDEPLLIARATGVPVFVAPKRPDAVEAALLAHPLTNVVICDDGLQHYALQRDLNIAVFDERGVGNGWLLPAGPLREPWSCDDAPPESTVNPVGVRPVDLVIHSGNTPAFKGYASTRRLADFARASDGREIALTELRGKRLCAVAGIAKPQAFFDMLASAGLALAKTYAFPDHHLYSAGEIAVASEETLLCTEKDAVKLFEVMPDAGMKLLAVPLEFMPEAGFFEAFDRLLAQADARRSPLPSPHGHKTS
ncbi:MAG: tetraacyldisaccharide 4'-kinase [Pseudomonadota bacterium]